MSEIRGWISGKRSMDPPLSFSMEERPLARRSRPRSLHFSAKNTADKNQLTSLGERRGEVHGERGRSGLRQELTNFFNVTLD